MTVVERKLNELEELTRTPEFLGLTVGERRTLLDDYYRQELAPQGVDRSSFVETFGHLWRVESAPESVSARKQLNLRPLWWTLGLIGGTAVALTGLVLWTNNLQDVGNQDDDALLRNLRAGTPVREEEIALRRSLPDTGFEVWEVEKTMERILEPIKDRGWIEAKAEAARTTEILSRNEPKILERVPPQARARAVQAIADLRLGIRRLEDKIYAEDVPGATLQLRQTFWYLDLLQLAMLSDYKVEVPAQYSALPRLNGGWTMVKFTTDRGEFTTLVDGFNAPLTAGNFLDLVQRGFYNGLKITRAERFNLIQTGDPKGDGFGNFRDPATGKDRNIPLEVRPARKETEISASQIIERRVDYVQDRYEADPLKLRDEMAKLHTKYIAGDWNAVPYGETIQKFPALPYGPPGVLSMARFEKDPNSASSQFFISFSDPELNPTGNNLSDGKYASFGYVTQGLKSIRKLQVGDTIKKVEILNCDKAQFNELRELDYAGSSMYTAKAAPNTIVEAACLPLSKPRLVAGR